MAQGLADQAQESHFPGTDAALFVIKTEVLGTRTAIFSVGFALLEQGLQG